MGNKPLISRFRLCKFLTCCCSISFDKYYIMCAVVRHLTGTPLAHHLKDPCPCCIIDLDGLQTPSLWTHKNTYEINPLF